MKRLSISVLFASLALLFGCGSEVTPPTAQGQADDGHGHDHGSEGSSHDEDDHGHEHGEGGDHDHDGDAGHTDHAADGDGHAGGSEESVANGGARATVNPDLLRKGPKVGEGRYETGIERKDFGYDLSKVKLEAPKTAEPADDGHDHDHKEGDGHEGHEHAADDAPASGGLRPPAVSKGRVAMFEEAPQSHDFGKLRQGELGHHRFDFVSEGEEPLIINTIKPSCGCTKADITLLNADGSEEKYVKGNEIAVGQRFYLEAEITTDGKPAGPFNAQVQLYGNDPRGAFSVRMNAEIQPVLEVKPSMTAFLGRITTAETAEQTVTVRSVGGEPFSLEPNAAGIVEPLKVELKPLDDEDGDQRASEWEVHLKLGPDIPVGMRYYPVVFKSDIEIPHPKYTPQGEEKAMYTVQVNVQAQVVGMVHAEPNFVNFGIVRPSTPIERTLQLEVHDDFKLTKDIPVEIVGYQGQEFPFPDAFETEVLPSDDGRSAQVKVKLNGLPEEHGGSFGGMFKIEIGHPHMKELQVRFSGVARQDLRRK